MWVFALPASGSPLGLNLYDPDLGSGVVAETAPGPVFRLCAQTARDRVAVQVAQLGNEAAITAHVVIVITLLPER